jgi:hypothetical protein
MVDFIDAVEVVDFSTTAVETGYEEPGSSTNCVMWPNAILDRGQPLASWLPQYDLDLNFPIKTERSIDGAVVVYASNRKLNHAGFPLLGPAFWGCLARSLGKVLDAPVVVIGASIDVEFSNLIHWPANARVLVNKTTLAQVAGIIQRARVVVGVISGMTILANHFRVPTVAFVQDRYHAEFPYTWVAPDAPYSVLRAGCRPTVSGVLREAQLLVGRR